MQYINDDMDELFRRAAVDYPLNTGSADWNVVLKKLSEENTGMIAGNNQSKKYNRLLLLLLLLPVIWLGKDYFYKPSVEGVNDGKTVKENVSKNKLSSSKPGMATSLGNLSTPGVTLVLRDDNSAPIQLRNHNNATRQHKGTLQSSFVMPVIDHISEPDRPAFSVIQNENDKSNATVNDEVVVADIKNRNENIAVQQEDNKNENNKAAPSKMKAQKQREHGVYAGLVVSPDVSTVKFQSIKNAGLSVGLVLGYQLNKSVSIETGLAWSKKYYHSDGKYFKAKNIPLPAYAQIKQLDGICKMIEVPVSIRYNFRSSAKTNVSVAGGLSSYIMKRENYDYTIQRNGVQYAVNASYKNVSSNLFSVVNLCFGYNRYLWKKSVLRLESFLKIPVKGLGIGDLPIMSTGINIAVTKKFFK